MRIGILIALTLAGCSEGKKVQVTQVIDMTGGSVETGDGTTVTIPAGALTAQAMITVESVNIQPPAGTVQVGPAYDFGPEGASFANPIAITLPFAPDRIPSRNSADVRVYTAPRGSSAFVPVPTTIEADVLAKTTTTHFTTYVPLAPQAGACVPQCYTGDGCGCSATCDGKRWSINCTFTADGPMCPCVADGSPTGITPSLASCSETTIRQAFETCIHPG